MRRKGIRSVFALAVVAYAFSLAQIATAHLVSSRGRKPVALGLRWKLLAQGSFDYDPGYGIAYITEPTTGAGLLIDDRPGQPSAPTSIAPPPSGCEFGGIQGPWIVTECGYSVDLRSLIGNAEKDVSYASEATQVCGAPGLDLCNFGLAAVGADWLEYSVSLGTPGGGQEAEYFQNIDTGAWRRTLPRGHQTRSNPPRLQGLSARTMLDLDSPSLVRSVCPPISLPDNGSLILSPLSLPTAISPVSFYGSFALTGDPYSSGPFYLQRCGSRKRLKITEPGTGNSKIILSGTQNRAIEMTNGRTITFRLPPHLPPPLLGPYYVPIVGDTHMFVVGNYDEVWEAALPPTMRGS
jgi:hypothetical protein